MRYAYALLFSVALLLGLSMPISADTTDECYEGTTRSKYSENPSFFCHYNTCTGTAVLVQRQVASKPYYAIDAAIIPRMFNLPVADIGMQGSSSSTLDFRIVEIGEGALKNCTATSLSFTLPSNIEIIRQGALSEMANMTGSLELPEGLRLVEEEGVYTGFTSLVLPSTLDSLSTSAILLDNVTTIVFKGMTPPRCGLNGGFTPWNKEGVATPKDVNIVIPEGTYEAYLNTPGIGDYFTYFKKDLPSGLEQTEQVVKKGIYSITGTYLGTDETILPRGIYIINGKKVVK